ncbi:MAG: iron-sulfur cluster carrier protein MrpORP [bacterium]
MTNGRKHSADEEESYASKKRMEGESDEHYQSRQELAHKMSHIKHKVIVISGKGGVGKSTVAVNLAITMALEGASVGLLDVDLHGPSVPKLLNIENARPILKGDLLFPIDYTFARYKILVMSIGLLLTKKDDAVIWRGPMKMSAIRQLLNDVRWGSLDFLIIDSPPGTGDEPLSVVQMLDKLDGAVVVTTPQDVALIDVRKSITFCRRLNVPVLGVVENMSGLKCPYCDRTIDVFKTGGGRKMAEELGIPFLGSVPIDPEVVESGDLGNPFVLEYSHTETGQAFEKIAGPILALERVTKKKKKPARKSLKKEGKLRIAVPASGGKLCGNFSKFESITIFDVDGTKIKGRKVLSSLPKSSGALPKLLSERGIDLVIAGGIGERMRQFLEDFRIEVVAGAPLLEADEIVKQYLDGQLVTEDD